MVKKVLFESAGPIHGSQYNLIDYPPAGYQFSVNKRAQRPFLSRMLLSPRFEKMVRGTARVLPLSIINAYTNSLMNREDVQLIYAYNHIILRKVPWIVHVEHAHFLAGFHVRVFEQFKKIIIEKLESNYCKGILVWAEIVRKNVLQSMNSPRIKDKLHVVYPAVPIRYSSPRVGRDKIKILFVTSGRNPSEGEFHKKGGKEVLKAFETLDREYPNLELTIRAVVPSGLRDMANRCSNVKIIDKLVSKEVIDHEFKTADILVHPTHDPLNTIIPDAMSYGLPVIVTDFFNYGEWVTDGVTGFVVRHADEIPDYWGNYFPPGPTPIGRSYDKALRNFHPEVSRRLAEKLRILIQDEPLRRRMSQAALGEVERGKFSIKRRNAKLKKIFDEATAI